MALTLVSSFDLLFASLAVAGQLIIAFGIISFLVFWKKKNPVFDFAVKHAVLFAFVVAAVSMSGSLFYSEVAKYTPCVLCWYQRILMYPEVLLLAVAILMKDRKISSYILPMTLIGMSIAAYHYLLQIGIAPEGICSAVGYSVSCSQIFTMDFGYITIPMMSLTAFSMITMFMLIHRFHGRHSAAGEKPIHVEHPA